MDLTFEYALQSPCGRFYTGRAGDGWLGEKHEAFKYTMEGAYTKIDTIELFQDFQVVRVV